MIRTTSTILSSIRIIIIVAIVFLVALLFTNIIGAPVIAILTYFVLQYRRRVKELEKRLTGPQISGSAQDIPPPPPMSTDA